MKKSLRLVTLAVVVFLLTNLLGAAVFAHTFTDVKEYDEAIGTLTSVGVIRGQTSTIFNPNSNIKRWQMALLLTKLLTAETNDTLWEKTTGNIAFSDVTNSTKHYGGSIAYAVSNGIIIGRSATEFAPDDGITLQDAVTMVVRSLQYPRSTYDPGYPDSYLTKGAELGLLDSLSDVDATDILTRGETAQLLYNAFRAERYDGSTIQEKVFGYEAATMVLAADDQQSLDGSITLAAAGKIAFHVLNSDGTMTNRASLTMAADDLEAELEFGASYRIAMCKGDILSIEKCKSTMIYDKLVVSSASSTKIAINSVVYTPTTRYTYDLEEGKVPTGSKEIIIYGLSDLYYTPYQVLTSEELYGTTARYELTGFDDNGDGYLDRAIYKPYSFGQYTIDGSTTKITGKDKNISFQTSRVKINGAKPTSGAYILYNYNKDTAELEVESVMSQADAYFKSYASGKVTLYTSSVNNVKTYGLGNSELPGVDATAVTNAIRSLSSGASVRFVTDGSNILAVVSATGTGSGSGNNGGTSNVPTYSENTIVSTSVGVVSRVDASSAAAGTMMVYLNNFTSLVVTSLNGVSVSSLNCSLAVGDLVQYTQIGASYSVTILNDKVYVNDTVSGSVTGRTAFVDYTGNYVGMGYKTGTSSSATSTYIAQVSATNNTVVYYYNGTSISSYTANNLSGGMTIGSGYSMYVVINASNATAANMIYIRPAVTAPESKPTVTGGTKLTGNYAIVTGVNASTASSGYIGVNIKWASSNSANGLIYVSAVNNVVVSANNIGLAVGDLISYELTTHAPTNGPSSIYYKATRATAAPYIINNLTQTTYISYSGTMLTVGARALNNTLSSLGTITVSATTPMIFWDGIDFTVSNVGSLRTSDYNGAYSVYAVYPASNSVSASFIFIRPNYVVNNNTGSGSGSGIGSGSGTGNVVTQNTLTATNIGYISAIGQPMLVDSLNGYYRVTVAVAFGSGVSTYEVDMLDGKMLTRSVLDTMKVGMLVNVQESLQKIAQLYPISSGAYAALKQHSYLFCDGGYFYVAPSRTTTNYSVKVPVSSSTVIAVLTNNGVQTYTASNCSLTLGNGYNMYVIYSNVSSTTASMIYFTTAAVTGGGVGSMGGTTIPSFTSVVYIPSATGSISSGYVTYMGYNVLSGNAVSVRIPVSSALTNAGYYYATDAIGGAVGLASTTPIAISFDTATLKYVSGASVVVTRTTTMTGTQYTVSVNGVSYVTNTLNSFVQTSTGLTRNTDPNPGGTGYRVFIVPATDVYANSITLIKTN